VYLETESGKIKARARLSELIMPGVVWTPSHPEPNVPYEKNAGQPINTIIPSAWDRVGAQYNGFACRLTKDVNALTGSRVHGFTGSRVNGSRVDGFTG